MEMAASLPYVGNKALVKDIKKLQKARKINENLSDALEHFKTNQWWYDQSRYLPIYESMSPAD